VAAIIMRDVVFSNGFRLAALGVALVGCATPIELVNVAAVDVEISVDGSTYRVPAGDSRTHHTVLAHCGMESFQFIASVGEWGPISLASCTSYETNRKEVLFYEGELRDGVSEFALACGDGWWILPPDCWILTASGTQAATGDLAHDGFWP
jgi:hypothetical protein